MMKNLFLRVKNKIWNFHLEFISYSADAISVANCIEIRLVKKFQYNVQTGNYRKSG